VEDRVGLEADRERPRVVASRACDGKERDPRAAAADGGREAEVAGAVGERRDLQHRGGGAARERRAGGLGQGQREAAADGRRGGQQRLVVVFCRRPGRGWLTVSP
jgi:hypothetical protein